MDKMIKVEMKMTHQQCEDRIKDYEQSIEDLSLSGLTRVRTSTLQVGGMTQKSFERISEILKSILRWTASHEETLGQDRPSASCSSS